MKSNVTDRDMVYVCKCGRIHIINADKLNTAYDNNKELMHICGHCGVITRFGADVGPDIYSDTDAVCYTLYNYSVNNTYCVMGKELFETTNGKSVSEIVYSAGIPVPMVTGENATLYTTYSGFYDNTKPYFYDAMVGPNDLYVFVKEHLAKSRKVDMQRFIAENDEQVLRLIATHYIEGLEWEGTDYALCV